MNFRIALFAAAFAFTACSTAPAKPDAPAAAAAPAAADHCAGESEKAQAPTGADAAVPALFEAAPAVGTKVRCPVSGEVFTVAENTARGEYNGKHVAFCCPGCKGRFEANPAAFVAK
jgi:Cu+-exporting ATPase